MSAKQQNYQKRPPENITKVDNQGWGSQKIPYSQEAEEAVIGSVLVNPNVFIILVNFLKADDFFILRHQYIWEALIRLTDRGDAIDYLTVIQVLKDMGKLGDIGGPNYLTQLINNTPNSTLFEMYGQLVQRAATRRRLMAASDEMKALAVNEDITIEQVITESESKFFDVVGPYRSQNAPTLAESLDKYLNEIQERVQYRLDGGTASFGVPTGLRDLDAVLKGLHRRTVTIVGGVTGMGKTSFVMTVALNAASLGVRVAYIPLERDREWVINRLLAMETGIDRQRITNGELTKAEFQRLVAASERIGSLPIHVYEKPHEEGWSMTPKLLLSTSKAIALEHGLDLLIVDHMGCMTSGGQRVGYDDKAYVSSAMPVVAQKLNVPMLIAAQINVRKVNARSIKRRRPELGDLEYVGEKDMDSCLFLYRDAVYNQKAEDKTLTEILRVKDRDGGSLGTTFAQYNGERYLDLPRNEPVERDMKQMEPQPHWSDR